jgi:hypothetical protein
MNTKRYTGLILKDNILHIYESADELRNTLTEIGTDWSLVAWLDHGIVYPPTGKSYYIGMILREGVLHLYESAEFLRKEMMEFKDHWFSVKWINGVEYHNRTT